MAGGLSRAPAEQASLRRLAGGLFVAYLVFVVYGSLVPLDYVALPFDEALARFRAVPMLNLGIGSRADLVANLLLYIPLAFAGREWLVGARRGPGAAAASLALWAVLAALAVAIEFVQVFFPARTVSQNDMVAEATGAAAGLLLHRLYGGAVRAWLLGWWRPEVGAPVLLRVLVGYLVLLGLFSLMPLDLTLSPVEIYHKAREGRVNLVPFADLPHEPAQLAYDVVADLLLWAPLGLLWRLLGRGVGAAVWRGALASAVVEVLQLFVYSRTSSTTDVLTAAAGCAIGAALAPAAWRARAAASLPARTGAGAVTRAAARGAPASTAAASWAALTALWAIVALALFWYPFDFRFDPGFLSARVAESTRIPFLTYYIAGEFNALNELLRKMLVFLPGGLLWAACVAAAPAARRPLLRRLGLVGAVALAALVEGVQLALPEKVADLTDLILEAAGGWLGLAIGARLFGGATAAASAPRGTERQPRSAERPPRAALPVVPWRPWPELLVAAALAAGLWFAARQPGVPYNVVELFSGDVEGAAAALGVSLVAAWLFALPLWLHAWLRGRTGATARLLVALPLLGLPPGLLLLATAPTESLEDVLGAPVLHWPPGVEFFVRYLALHGGLAIAAIGAAWLVRRLATGEGGGMLTRWAIAAVVWAPVVHWGVVAEAATDNLVELMRDGGGPVASAWLALGLLALFTGASAVAALAAGAGRPARLAVAAAVAWPLATWALWQGSEHALFKYERVFSAAQFLLSADRDHYASPAALLHRWLLACIGLAIVVTLLQWPGWRRVRAARAGRG